MRSLLRKSRQRSAPVGPLGVDRHRCRRRGVDPGARPDDPRALTVRAVHLSRRRLGFVIVKNRCGSSLSAGVVVLALVALTGACSSSSAHVGAPLPARPAAASPAQYKRPPCRQTRPTAFLALKSPDGPSEYDVTSFTGTGTRIRVHWFPNPHATAAAPRPTILKGPGWSQPGDTDTKTRGNGLFTCSRGTHAGSASRTEWCRPTLPTSRAVTRRCCLTGSPARRKCSSTVRAIRGSAWWAVPTAAVSSWCSPRSTAASTRSFRPSRGIR